MPMNSDCSCFWSLNNGLCAWSKGMTSCAWEKDSYAWNTLLITSSCHEHAWTGHEHGMNCAWSYYDSGHKKHKIWAEIPKFHGVFWAWTWACTCPRTMNYFCLGTLLSYAAEWLLRCLAGNVDSYYSIWVSNKLNNILTIIRLWCCKSV